VAKLQIRHTMLYYAEDEVCKCNIHGYHHKTDKPRVSCLQCISEYSVMFRLSRGMSLYRVLCVRLESYAYYALLS